MPRQRLVASATPFALAVLTLLAIGLAGSAAGSQGIHTDDKISALSALAPAAVSPGDAARFTLSGGDCPTFSWGSVEDASSYDLVVYGLAGEGEDSRQVLRQTVAGSASSWTPSLERCLERGGRYAWSIRALHGQVASPWSPPNLFQVAAGPSLAQFEEALAVVRSYLAAQGETAPEAAIGEAAEGHGKPAEAPARLAPPGTQLSIDGNVNAVSFSGGGALLTGLDPANLSAGTAAIDISGNAATAGTAASASDLACTDCIGAAEIDSTGLEADLLDGLDSTDLAPASHDHLGEVWLANTGNGLQVDLFSSDQYRYALHGRMTAATAGLFSAAVRGENLALASGLGVWGSDAGNGIGTLGTTQTGVGLLGSASGSGGTAVWGSAAATSGVNYGVRGETSSPSGFAGYFTGRTHVAGPLGIGTTSPGWPLSILAPQAVAQLDSSSNTNGSVIELKSSVLNGTFLGAINFNNFANTFPGQIAYRGDNAMTFRTNGAERMRITSTGRVGINTTAPQAELHVNGSIAIAPTQRWLSIAAPAFSFTWSAISDMNSILRGSTYFALKDHGISPGLVTVKPEYANVALPDGAKIRELVLRADNSGVTLSLVRIHIDLDTVDTLAQLASTGSGGNTTSTTAIAAGMETVDNSTYAYVLEAQDPRDDSPNETLLRAVRIRYEITSPLP